MLAGCKWAICEHAINSLSMGRPATFWPSQTGRPFHRNGPLLGRAMCRHIIGAFGPMSRWYMSQRWGDTCLLQPMMILHVENPHWSGLLTGYWYVSNVFIIFDCSMLLYYLLWMFTLQKSTLPWWYVFVTVGRFFVLHVHPWQIYDIIKIVIHVLS